MQQRDVLHHFFGDVEWLVCKLVEDYTFFLSAESHGELVISVHGISSEQQDVLLPAPGIRAKHAGKRAIGGRRGRRWHGSKHVGSTHLIDVSPDIVSAVCVALYPATPAKTVPYGIMR